MGTTLNGLIAFDHLSCRYHSAREFAATFHEKTDVSGVNTSLKGIMEAKYIQISSAVYRISDSNFTTISFTAGRRLRYVLFSLGSGTEVSYRFVRPVTNISLSSDIKM